MGTSFRNMGSQTNIPLSLHHLHRSTDRQRARKQFTWPTHYSIPERGVRIGANQ